MHRIRSDQLYHHLGASLEVLLLYPGGNGEVVSVGSNLAAGERPPAVLTEGPLPHTSRLAPGADYALLASTEWPGVEQPDVEHGDVEALTEAYPNFREEIRAFTA
jgi:uncharacterized protein